MKWVKVYSGLDMAEAHVLRDWLVDHGLTVQLRGEHLSATMGMIPSYDACPSVWVVKEQEAQAAEAIQAYDEAGRTEEAAWVCPRCEAENDGHFGSCWQCSRDRPGLRGRPA